MGMSDKKQVNQESEKNSKRKKIIVIIIVAILLVLAITIPVIIYCLNNESPEETEITEGYTVTFYDDDGKTILETIENVNYGEIITYSGEKPSKDSTEQYEYTFVGWATDENGVLEITADDSITVYGDATYYAVYYQTDREYSVNITSNIEIEIYNLTQENYVYSDSTVHYSDELCITYTTTTGHYVSEFQIIGLTESDKEGIYIVTDNVEIICKESIKTYKVIFGSNITVKDGEYIIENENTVEYGTELTIYYEETVGSTMYKITINGYDITAEIRDEGYYIYKVEDDGLEIEIVYIETEDLYTVTFCDEDGENLLKTFENLKYGETITYGEVPSKDSTELYEYTFIGWATSKNGTVEIVADASITVYGDATYYAVYYQTDRKYSVNFFNGDNLLYTASVYYGNSASYEGTTELTKSSENPDLYTYTFAGWVTEAGESVDLNYITSSIDVYALFTITYKEYKITSIQSNVKVSFVSSDYNETLENDEELSVGSVLYYGDIIKIEYIGIEEENCIVVFDLSGVTSDESNGNYSVIGDISISYEYSHLYLTFEKVTDGYEVSGLKNTSYKTIVIPSTFNGETVVGIGSAAFKDTSITSVTIPDSVTYIAGGGSSTGAFYGCSSLETVTIGSGITSIGDYAFYDCSELTTIYYSSTIENWLSISFGSDWVNNGYSLYIEDSELTSLTLSNELETIPDYAFYYCTSIETVTIDSDVISIGDCAFRYCTNLTEIKIESEYVYEHLISETALGYLGYYATTIKVLESIDDESNKYLLERYLYRELIGNYYIYSNTESTAGLYDENATLKMSWDELVSNEYIKLDSEDGTIITYSSADDLVGILKISNTITEIAVANTETEGVFYQCNGLISVIIPGSVKSIGDYAFRYCRNLITVTLGSGVESIGSRTFYECTSLTTITLPDSLNSIGEYAFYGCSVLKSVTIPDEVKTINEYAFAYCFGLTSLTIGSGVESIGSYAFRDCRSLTSVTIPDNVVSIGNYAFYFCLSLISIEIGGGVESIGDYAFRNCQSLISVTIPDNVENIGDFAFYYCISLTSIKIGSGVESIGESTFSYCTSLASIIVDTNNTVYTSRDTNGEVNAIIEISTGTLLIGCSKTVIPTDGSVISIGNYAFYGSGLTEITIPDSVTSIGSNTFQNCINLTEIIIENKYVYNNLTSISSCGYLGESAITIKVLKTIENEAVLNTYLNDSEIFEKDSGDDNYYIYTKLS